MANKIGELVGGYKPVEPGTEQVTAQLLGLFTQEKAEDEASRIFEERVDFAKEQGRRYEQGLKQTILTAVTGTPLRDQLEMAKRQALEKMGLGGSAPMYHGDSRYDEYWGLVGERVGEMVMPMGERRGQFELARAVMEDVAGCLIEANVAINPLVRGSQLFGSVGLNDNGFDKLPEELRGRIGRAKYDYEMMQVLTTGRLALKAGNGVALPVLLAAGNLEDEETIEEIRGVLGALPEEERGKWLELLGRCSEIIDGGGKLGFGGSLESVEVEIAAGGWVTKIEKLPAKKLEGLSRDGGDDVGVARAILGAPEKRSDR